MTQFNPSPRLTAAELRAWRKAIGHLYGCGLTAIVPRDVAAALVGVPVEQEHQHQRHAHRPVPRRSAGDAYREGFQRGAVDSLRVLCRQVDDPSVWAACHAITGAGGGS